MAPPRSTISAPPEPHHRNRRPEAVRRFISLGVYNALLPLALLLLLPTQLLKMRRRGGYLANAGERLARYDAALAARLSPGCWWVHAVSVGETLVALKLINGLRASGTWSGPIALTCTTSTGRRLAMERADAATTVLWMPLDLPWVADRALRALRPHRILLVEAEVWPNLLHRAWRKGIPTCIVNARLSDRSEARFRRFRFLIAPLFSLLDAVFVQDEADHRRFSTLGISPDRIHTTGSVKFDDEGESTDPSGMDAVRARLEAQPEFASAKKILAASTHPGEETVIGKAWLDLGPARANTRLILVPRHFERARAAAENLERLGIRTAMRSEAARPEQNADCLVVDSTGELRAWYAFADLVVMGKSFAGHSGGQNPAEPIRAGRPVITGPRMDNFSALVNALEAASGILRLADESELPVAMRDLLENPDDARALATRGASALARHRGATRRTIGFLHASPGDDPADS